MRTWAPGESGRGTEFRKTLTGSHTGGDLPEGEERHFCELLYLSGGSFG